MPLRERGARARKRFMPNALRATAGLFLALALSACATAPGARLAAPAPPDTSWAFEKSDVPVDPAFRFGRLDNGLRYVIRQNRTPAGTGLVRMEVAAGSIDEGEAERGFAHFVEHMAFNGSTRVPEGEMVRLLERKGLAFGADTNAQTSFDRTTYLLDLPRNDAELLDTALMLMRETASELTFSPEVVARESGVILAERRDRDTYLLRNLESQLQFFNPGSRYADRLPIGKPETIAGATAEALKAFWRREYVPSQTTVVVIGDFDPVAVEALVRQHFASWAAAPAEPQPDAGPVKVKDKGRTAVYIDPALSERVTATRNGPWLDEPDTIVQRQENLLRQVGYGIVNRRLQRLSREADPPFRSAGFGTGAIFRSGRSTNLVLDSVDGKWQRGLTAAALEYRRALKHGFTQAEVAEQIANIRTASQNAAASAETRSHATLVEAVYALLRERRVPATPQSALERLEAFIPQITPDTVLAALKREALPLKAPLIRLQGRRDPKGGATAIRAAWDKAMRAPLPRDAASGQQGFAYTGFGPPGTVTADSRENRLGIRQVRYANGVRLNLKRTDIEKDRILVALRVDGGDMLRTRDNPLATDMVSFLAAGGLGKHSLDDLQSILAGRTVGVDLASTAESFATSRSTTPRDLELQLQLMTALLTDPGYRPEGETQYRLNINNFFARLRATPASALSGSIGGILSDNDPRFTLQKPEAYRALTFARLKADIAERLAKGAIEIAIVGDVDEDAALALVARTFGALPVRETDFRAYAEQRQRPFTSDRSPRIIRHTGPADQALLRLTWPTTGDRDPAQVAAFDVLERVLRIALTESLREKLGKAYSPGASSDQSRVWPDYGTVSLTASVAVAEVPAARAAVAEALAELRDVPPSADTFQRALQPLLEAHDNALKTNGGWLSLATRAQSLPDLIERHARRRADLEAVTPAALQALARQFLNPGQGVEILVLPEGVEVPR
ncbi:MAG: hypothetical protein RIQ46_453 [Pseudomonadota bacterium]